jgi:hypothetical protein
VIFAGKHARSITHVRFFYNPDPFLYGLSREVNLITADLGMFGALLVISLPLYMFLDKC